MTRDGDFDDERDENDSDRYFGDEDEEMPGSDEGAGEIDVEIGRLIDGKLSREESEKIQDRIRHDKGAREKLISALTVRTLLELAKSDGKGPKLPGDCVEARQRVIGYQKGGLTAKETAEFSKHLEDCFECEIYSEGFLARPKRSRQRKLVIASLITVGSFVTIGLSALTGALAFKSPSVSPEISSLPQVPLLELAKILVDREHGTDASFLDDVVRISYAADPGFRENALRHPGVSDLVDALQPAGATDALPDDIVLLIAFFFDFRLDAETRSFVLGTLARRVGDPIRPWLWELIEESHEEVTSSRALIALVGLKFEVGDAERLRRAFDKLTSRGMLRYMNTFIQALHRAGHPDARTLGLQILEGRFGRPAGLHSGNLAECMLRVMDKDEPPIVADIKRIASNGPDELGRVVCIDALDGMDASRDWHAEVMKSAGSVDPMVRLIVATHLQLCRDDKDAGAVARFATDPSRAVQIAVSHLIGAPSPAVRDGK